MYRLRSRSIGNRLIFLNTVMTFVILAVSGLLLDWVLRSDMQHEDKRFLFAEIQSIRILLKEYAHDQNVWKSKIERDASASVSTYAQYHVRISGVNGSTVFETPGMPPVPYPAVAGTSYSSPHLMPVSYAQFSGLSEVPLLVATARARDLATPAQEYTIQIALDMTHETAIINSYRQKVVFVILGGILFSIILGFFITKDGLKPLKKLTQKIRQVTPHTLEVRVGGENWPKEIVALANDFDMMLERLEISFRFLSQFSADLAHELRTPINNLRGEAEVMISRVRTVDEYRQVIISALEEYERLSRIIETLLFLARSDSNKQTVTLSALNIRQEIADVLEYYDAVKEEKNIFVAIHGNGTVRADKALFRRVLGNVLSNAFRYTQPGGKIVIDIDASSASQKRITITDNGIGIEADDLPYIFDRFFRTAKARAVCPQGTGLGFSIVKAIMDLHGGNVKVTSEPPSGTVVRLEFLSQTDNPINPLLKARR